MRLFLWLLILLAVSTVVPETICAQEGEHNKADNKLPEVPRAQADAAKVPEGYRVEVVMRGLTYPTSVEFDDKKNMYVAEAGYSYGDPKPEARVLAVSPEGKIRTVASEGLNGPVTDLLWHKGRLYIAHRGEISVLQEEGKLRDLVTDLPSDGDHHNNQMTAGPDGKIYFGQGTATNSGVVGIDNLMMGWLREHPDFHDIPAKEIRLKGHVYETSNPLKQGEQTARTSAYHPFAKAAPEGSTIPGQVKASGTILRMDPDGTNLDVYAWGLRNPYGVLWAPDGKLYASENGFDVRGSRPIADDKEDLYVIKEGGWYGWPDYGSGIPVTDQRFKPEGKPQPEFLMAEHPPVEEPLMTFPPHSAATKMDVSRSEKFGHTGQLFLAFFGHMAPMTGTVEGGHAGHRVVRIDPEAKTSEVFFTQAGHGHSGDGHSSSSGKDDVEKVEKGGEAAQGKSGSDGHGHAAGGHGGASGGHGGHGGSGETVTEGPRRLMDVRFSPDGDALYITDFGTMVIRDKPVPVPGTGVIWRVVPDGVTVKTPPTDLMADSDEEQ